VVDYAGNLGRQLQLIGSWDGKQLEQGYQSTAGKITKAAGTMATKTSGLVNQKMGRAMSQFNEKTEKGRQLLTTFGGAVGGAAGNIVYYTGTLSYVIGRFSVWELAIMGAVAAIGGLVYALTRESEAEKEWAARMDASREALDKMTTSVNDFVTAQNQQLEGWSQAEVRLAKVDEEMDQQHRNYTRAIADIKKWKDEAPAIDVLEGQYPAHLVTAYYKSLLGMGAALKASTKLHAIDAAVKEAAFKKEMERQKDRDKKDKKPKVKKDVYEELTGAPGIYGMAPDAIRQAIAFNADVIAAETEYQSIKLLKDLKNKEDTEKQAILEAELDWERRRRKAILDIREEEADKKRELDEEEKERKTAMGKVMMDGVAIFEEMGALMASSEEANTAVRVAAIMARAGWRMYEEIAEGVATSVTQPWVAASHYAAAGLFAAIAAGDVAAAMSSGGGGGGGVIAPSDRAGMQGASPWDTEKRETTIIIQLGDREIRRVVYDAYEGHKDDLNPNRKRKVVGYG